MKRKPMDPAVRQAVMERDQFTCQRCYYLPATEAHHRLYRSRGGTDDPINLVSLCNGCHMAVHAASEAPYVVAGYITRGRYVGPDEAFQAFFNEVAA